MVLVQVFGVCWMTCVDVCAWLFALQSDSRQEVKQAAISVFPLFIFNLGPNFMHLIKQCLQCVIPFTFVASFSFCFYPLNSRESPSRTR